MDESAVQKFLVPTKFDLALANFFPSWAASRQRARREFSYEAAKNTRLRPSAQRLQGPEDYTAFLDRIQLIKEMRNLVSNFGLFQSIIDKLAIYAFGRIRYQAHTSSKDISDQYEDFLADRFQNIDMSGRHDLWSLTAIAFKSGLTDGDYSEQWVRDPMDGQLKLIGIEGDRLGGMVAVSTSPDYFQGITIDIATGRPLTYRVFTRTKANAYINPIDIGANDVIYYFDPRRIDQYRGVTPFAPVINEAKDLKEVLQACLIGTKFENYHSAIGYTDNGLPLNPTDSYFQGTNGVSNGTTNTPPEQELKYGVVQWAPSGSKVDFIKSDRPSANFQSYLDMLIRLIGTAVNLPYGFVYNMAGLSGPSARMDAQQAYRTVQWHQQNMVNRRLNKIKNTLIMDGIAQGMIPYDPKWNKGEWQFPAAPSIDAGRDSAAAVDEIIHGMRSKADWYDENGQDSEEQEEVIAEEASRTIDRAQKLAKDKDIPIDLALTLLEVRTPNGFLVTRSISAKTPDVMDAEDIPVTTAPPAAEDPLNPNPALNTFQSKVYLKSVAQAVATEMLAKSDLDLDEKLKTL